MGEPNHNISELANEYRELPSSSADLLDSIDRLAQNTDNSFNDGELAEADDFIQSYRQVRADVSKLNQESEKLLSYLRGEVKPTEPSEERFTATGNTRRDTPRGGT